MSFEENGFADQSSGSGHRDDRGRDSFSDEDLQDDEETGLTDVERKRRQKKRRRNTRLDHRVAREKNGSAQERAVAEESITRRLMINAILILLWYFFSLSISLVCPVLPFHVVPTNSGQFADLEPTVQ